MFTGLVVASASVLTVESFPTGGRRIAVRWPDGLARPRAGDSIAVDGVCLTARPGRGRSVGFDLSPETLARTTLGTVRPGRRVHLEPSLTLRSPLGGHFLTGHVDAVGRVRARTPMGEAFLRLDIDVPRALLPLIAVKGSLAVDGVSLTVNEKRGAQVSFMIVPHTLAVTRLGAYRTGTRVNLEVDLIARYVHAALEARFGSSRGERPRSRR
jgi:riboflavin synthase